MKNTFKIFIRDLSKIIKNPVAIIIISGLCILPSLYAWFNIKASWDPYGSTKGISVAVVNEDLGTSFNNSDINIGNDIVDKLKDNNKIGWKFVDAQEANYGLTHNKYYAYIEIPKNFSENITTLLSSNPVKPELIYKVNEKVNAVSPKITDSGANTLVKEITANFVDTVNKSIFQTLNSIGKNLDENKSKILSVKDAIISINDHMGDIKTSIDNAQKGTTDLNEFLKELEGNIPLMNDSIVKLQDTTNTGKNLVTSVQDSINGSIDSLKFKLNEIQLLNEDVQSLLKKLEVVHGDGTQSVDNLVKIIDILNSKLETNKVAVNSAINFLQVLHDKMPNNQVINKHLADLNKVKEKIDSLQPKLANIKDSLISGHEVSGEVLTFLTTTSGDINTVITDKINSFETTLRPAINDMSKNLIGTADNISTILNNAKNAIPKLQNLLELGKKGSELGTTAISNLQEVLPDMEQSIGNVSSKLNKINEDDINEIISILQRSPEVIGDFISNPVVLKEDRVFHIPNYGSAMTPFYTILSLWVGVLILSSILATDVEPFEDGVELKPLEKHFGRFLTFLFLALIQSLIVSLGDKYVLGVYMIDVKLFVGFCVFSSFIFTIIVYTLVSVFGNLGKATAIILLVLQVAGSGGTFPIEVTPDFFQKLQPLLPFTYAIGALREAVAGPIWSNVTYDIKIMLIFGVIFSIIGILLKGLLHKPVTYLHHKFKETGLSE